ncbi:MAG: enoyl-CoA hydratase/isomerase family protein [Hyphomicrobiales bacterium]|nr:enoyl-CoA hydratase/isomerase family protein [Hyphomicrobiales bacterium]
MPEMVDVRLQDGVAVITVSAPPVNTITSEVRSALNGALDQVAKLEGVRAIVLACAGSTFFSGADIGEFSGPPKEAEYRALFARLEQQNVPVVAALFGTSLGGGYEITLACHYRIAQARTRIGFPEVTLGIIPGAGGTQRLPRLIGAEKALDMIISAKPIDAKTALAYGAIDRIADGDVNAAAVAYARELVAAGAGPRRTCDMKVAADTATSDVFAKAEATAKKLYPNRIAALTAVEAIKASTELPIAEGLALEEKLGNDSKATPESKGAIHVFFAERATRKVSDIPADAKARKIEKAGIVGAGTMGGGIAICFANAGIPVTILDMTEEALKRGLNVVDATYESMVKRGRLSPEDKAKRMALINGALDYKALAEADVVIEAVFENMDVKKKIFAELDKVAKAGCVLATNTSTLDVEEIATATKRPQDVIGLHFFSPANVMPLLEIVRTNKTSAETIKTSVDLARPLKKTPVLVKVCYGFVGNRMMEPYGREAERMTLEGATPRQIDTAMEKWGMAMGLLAVYDMAGVDIGINVHKANADKYPIDPTYYQAEVALGEHGRYGQKSGKGFYKYEKGDRNRYDDPDAIEILAKRARELQVPQSAHSEEEIVERCLYPLINEGFRILEEGVAQRAADIDVVWTSGYGFPRYRGGPMHYAETVGLKKVLAGMLKYKDRFGPMHWEPAGLLVELANGGKTIADWEKARG